MAGRPPLRIGQRGKISRKRRPDGVWEAQCRVRDTDGGDPAGAACRPSRRIRPARQARRGCAR